jgi:phospholipase C
MAVILRATPYPGAMMNKSVLALRAVAGVFASIFLNSAANAQSQLQLAQQNIKHVIIIMQENHSFDTYFGTFPGADGIPPGTCVPEDPGYPGKGCKKPFHNTSLTEAGGPHEHGAYTNDYDNGLMDGFIYAQVNAALGCKPPTNPKCASFARGVARRDVVGYHDGTDIPNYWAYARTFVLQDHLFESVANWSYPSHLALVSGWYAKCGLEPTTCQPASEPDPLYGVATHPFEWTYLPYLLDASGVSWKYYLNEGLEPDCETGGMTCDEKPQTYSKPNIWNPIPGFALFTQEVRKNPAYVNHVTNFDTIRIDLANGTLPSVAWIAPGLEVSEHPPKSIKVGMDYVTMIVNLIAQSPYANSTAIFVSWDDWGGFYDHVPPPVSVVNPELGPDSIYGWGLRVPGLVISAWAKPGFIDHQYLSFDNYNRFIEDLFLRGARLDPATDGRPDNRPAVTEAITQVKDPVSGALLPVGDLLNDFDFTLPPRPIPILPTN